MSPYMSVFGPCFGCGRTFSFNADHVPSIPINGTREPICEDCMHKANAQRVAMGAKPHPVHPEAYEPQEVE